MNASSAIQSAGRLCGVCLTRHGRLYLDRRCAALPLTVVGAQHLQILRERPCLLVANHVLIRAENAPLGRWTQGRALTLLNQPPDSFFVRRIVREETGLSLHVVAKSDRGWWSPRPFVKRLQKCVGQPFGKGLLEGMEFVPVEHNPSCFHRTFFQSAAGPVGRGLPLLIFPGRLCSEDGVCRDLLADCRAGEEILLPGAAHLARKFSLPIIPVFIQGAESWHGGRAACVTIGPAFPSAGLTKAGINTAILRHFQALTAQELLAAS